MGGPAEVFCIEPFQLLCMSTSFETNFKCMLKKSLLMLTLVQLDLIIFLSKVVVMH